MGRPLKIAKSQAVLTITATGSGLGAAVTVSQNLTTDPTVGVIAGMPFVVASTVGGLVAGTTYYINAITGNHTFTVSTTQLSVQPQVLATLSTTSAQSVKATVGLIDYAFNNPNNSNTSAPSGSNASFGVVGGNTAQYGKQTLVSVAIGQNGLGQLATDSGSSQFFASVDPLTNITAGTVIQANVANINGISTDLVTLGTVNSVDSGLLLAITNTVATGNFIVTSGNAQTLASGAVWFDTSFGNIKFNTPYYLGTVANATHFTVLSSPGGANVPLSTLNGITSNLNQHTGNFSTNAAATYAVPTSYVFANEEAGYIVRQKGKTKYLVTGSTSGLTAQCYTANVANAALLPNTMSITATTSTPSTVYVQSLSDYQSQLFATTVADGSFTPGTQYVIYYSGNTNWTAIGAASNITGITFTATGAGGSGTGTAVLSSSSGETPSASNPDVIASFNTAYPANQFYTPSNPVVTINNA
jgi:hypothetical protein